MNSGEKLIEIKVTTTVIRLTTLEISGTTLFIVVVVVVV